MERRLSTILAADVVGYSSHMERDEAGTFERLRTRRKEIFEPEVEKHHGRSVLNGLGAAQRSVHQVGSGEANIPQMIVVKVRERWDCPMLPKWHAQRFEHNRHKPEPSQGRESGEVKRGV